MPAPVDICFHRCAHPMWLRLALHTPSERCCLGTPKLFAGEWVWDAWNSCAVLEQMELMMRVWLKEEGGSGGEKEGMVEAGLCEKGLYGFFTAKNCLEKHNLRRVGLFGAHVNYPLLFDSSVSERTVFYKYQSSYKTGKMFCVPPHTWKSYRIQVGSGFGIMASTQWYNAPASMATRRGIAFPYTSRPLHALM